MSTADRHAVGFHPRVSIGSAGWVNIGSAPTLRWNSTTPAASEATPAVVSPLGVDESIQPTSPRDFKPWETLSAPEAHVAGLFFYHQAAREIADAQCWSDARLQALLDAMASALNDGALRTRDRKTGFVRPPDNLDTLLLVTPEDVNDWLIEQRVPYRWVHPAAAESPKDAAPAEAEMPAVLDSGTVAQPAPLSTSDIADAFDGAGGQSAKQWRRKLGDSNNHKWLKGARAFRGAAPTPSTWWPLKFADLLLEERGVTVDSLNRLFLTSPKLKPWLAAWQDAKRQRNAFGR